MPKTRVKYYYKMYEMYKSSVWWYELNHMMEVSPDAIHLQSGHNVCLMEWLHFDRESSTDYFVGKHRGHDVSSYRDLAKLGKEMCNIHSFIFIKPYIQDRVMVGPETIPVTLGIRQENSPCIECQSIPVILIEEKITSASWQTGKQRYETSHKLISSCMRSTVWSSSS